MHPDIVKKSVENYLGKLIKILLAGQSLRLYCVSQDQKARALKCSSLGNINIECTEPRPKAFTQSIRFTKLIIFGVPLDITA